MWYAAPAVSLVVAPAEGPGEAVDASVEPEGLPRALAVLAGLVRFQVHQDRGVAMAPRQRELVNAEDGWCARGLGCCRTAEQAQEGVGAGAQPRAGGDERADLTTRGPPIVKEDGLGIRREVGVAPEHRIEALGEGPPPTGAVQAAEAPDGQTEADPMTAPGQVTWLTPVAIMDVLTGRGARRADASSRSTAGVEDDLPARPADRVNDQ